MHSLVAVATAAVSSTPSAAPRLGFDRASEKVQARTDVVGWAAESQRLREYSKPNQEWGERSTRGTGEATAEKVVEALGKLQQYGRSY